MDELVVFGRESGDKRMTVRELAAALGTAESTVRNKVAELFPALPRNGVATLLTEVQAVAIKHALVPRDLTLKSKVDSAVSDLEMMVLDKQIQEWKTRKIQELQEQLRIKDACLLEAQPKLESHDALMRSERTMSITDAAKHFGLHPKLAVFPYLRERGYLTSKGMPSQDSLDAGYLAVRQVHCADGEVRPQPVVLASQLETWRTRVVPQIRAWLDEEA